MKVSIFVILSILFVTCASAADVALLNTSIFGKSLSEQITVVAEHGPKSIQPSSVQLLTIEGRISSATLFYLEDAFFAEIKDKLISIYGVPSKKSLKGVTFDVWRVDSKKMNVHFTESEKVAFIYYQLDPDSQ